MGLRPRPHWGSSQCFPRPLAGFGKGREKGAGNGGKRRGGRKREANGRKGKDDSWSLDLRGIDALAFSLITAETAQIYLLKCSNLIKRTYAHYCFFIVRPIGWEHKTMFSTFCRVYMVAITYFKLGKYCYQMA